MITSRKISFGPRGLGIGAPKAVASTTTDHGEVKSTLSQAPQKGSTATQTKLDTTTPAKEMRGEDRSGAQPQEADAKGPDPAHSSESESQHSSRPIPIRKGTAIQIKEQGKMEQRPSSHRANTTEMKHRLDALQDVQEVERDDPLTDPDDADDDQPITTLSPSTKLAPWLTILNPSNPSKTKASLGIRLGRWHHIFPRPLKTSQIKWKSLCSPAAVPLTTEDFPSADQLADEYQQSIYHVDVPNDRSHSESPRSLVAELISFRLSRGFQIVVGDRLLKSTNLASAPLPSFEVFNNQILAQPGDTIYLSRGSTIHKVMRQEEKRVEIQQLTRYGVAATDFTEANSLLYKPAIRSMLSDEYDVQSVTIAPQKAIFDWKMIDSFIAGHEQPKAEDFVESLRPWRARFVLIPVDAPSSARRTPQTRNEDDEEEIRLEGIKKLTQVWQRFRYIPPDERRFQAPLRNKKDTNPLDIMYQTRNPSAIVAAELENVAEGDVTRRTVQLLPESDLYQRANFKTADLAATIQSEKGVRMLDRRWHWRLHYNCFIGFELTSWLLQNFRDVDTRDEAVDLGNDLMKSGMFKHVEQRHNFRDGNYFYQIADEYRAQRESRGWFGRGKASVPSTPMSEDPPRDPSSTGRSRAHSNSSSISESFEYDTSAAGKKKNLGVALSKSLLYDVDHRKRSYRPELINLHYDRLHNPDNCYHIRVEWMNTTPKLIQDAVISWATSVDRFGLRLVEVPLGEASSITSTHPFRAPYSVKLTQAPPVRQPQSYFDTTSFNPQPKTEKHFYQKAIMKRFNFVLDFEAASDFPPDVDVSYSWGKPLYRYPQYIHRSGMLIAQITDEGDFLLLANRLYNNRGGLASGYSQEGTRIEGTPESDLHRGPGFYRSSPHRTNTHNLKDSPRESPHNSPSVRATLDVPASTGGPPLANNTPHPTTSPHTKSATTPFKVENLLRDFEAFCHNAKALEIFYDEMLSKASTPGPGTPFMGGKTPLRGPMTPSRLPEKFTMESSIPNLALPGTLLDRREEEKGRGIGDRGERKSEFK
ncbi:SEA/GATOR complex protein SEA1/DEPDC5, partial [Lecanoromycetidae sp. Uapishka_2]